MRSIKTQLDSLEAHEDSTVANVARCVNKEFKRRVAKVIDPNSPDFDPIYAVATVLDPNNACLLDLGLKEVAETALPSMAGVEGENANSLVAVDTLAEPLDHPMMLTAKFGDYAKIILQQKKNMANAVGSDSLKCAITNYVASVFYEPPYSPVNPIAYWETEKKANAVGSDSLNCTITTYVASVFYEPPDSPVNPIAYWETEKKVHRSLKAVALRVLSIPASSAPVERVFSQAGIITGGRRLRMEQADVTPTLFVKGACCASTKELHQFNDTVWSAAISSFLEISSAALRLAENTSGRTTTPSNSKSNLLAETRKCELPCACQAEHDELWQQALAISARLIDTGIDEITAAFVSLCCNASYVS
ncbi:hypothetical protein Tcan_12811 [Toxocara canis]|uniref:HAT C-terminal dimerisation domain-containing protein n=1 Tax=Toxocara canis TaxID=6265 RepID=A0A0B2UT76_TOXCA|nr:hypothetical protein Tcan_12811 [Toxocara canis]